MPVLASVAQEFSQVKFIALTAWGDSKSNVADWMDGLKVSGVATGQASDDGARKLHALAGRQLEGIPATVFIAPDGTIREIMDFGSRDQFREAFEQASK